MLFVICEKVTQGRVEENASTTRPRSVKNCSISRAFISTTCCASENVFSRVDISVSGHDDTSKDRQGQRNGSPNKDDQLLLNIQIHSFSPPFALFPPSLQVYPMGGS